MNRAAREWFRWVLSVYGAAGLAWGLLGSLLSGGDLIGIPLATVAGGAVGVTAGMAFGGLVAAAAALLASRAADDSITAHVRVMRRVTGAVMGGPLVLLAAAGAGTANYLLPVFFGPIAVGLAVTLWRTPRIVGRYRAGPGRVTAA